MSGESVLLFLGLGFSGVGAVLVRFGAAIAGTTAWLIDSIPMPEWLRRMQMDESATKSMTKILGVFYIAIGVCSLIAWFLVMLGVFTITEPTVASIE